ncbi:unnamed protein product [Dicrocoelium dendriticum]|nr:unnamed protein product [Dicrocoelium dendriticum]
MPYAKVVRFGSLFLSVTTICLVLLKVASRDTTVKITYPSHCILHACVRRLEDQLAQLKKLAVFEHWELRSSALCEGGILDTGRLQTILCSRGYITFIR